MSAEEVPKALGPDDTIEYHLYPTECSREFLTRLAVECTHVAKSIAGGHIWHYEPFRLVMWPEDIKGTHPPHIFGTTCFRDNIEDEWLIVHLLFAVSKQCGDDLVISVTDSDGQFLLIEAAHHLPKWLKPETSTNRVFIHKGSLHIIPKPRTPAEVSLLPVATPTLREAIQLVRGEFPTEASDAVQEAIRKRISCFPAVLPTSLHRAHCFLPCPAAHVMSHDPQVVAAAVHALCERDPDDMRACRRLEYFSPARHTTVMAEVVFTRCLYVQLLHQRFSPPRNSGFKLPSQGSKPYDLGMKLTCGLEILLARVGGVSVKEEGRSSEVTGDPRWNNFVGSLKERGYFQNELEGSKLYCQLLETAKEYFTANMTTHGQEDIRDPLVSAGKRIARILHTTASSEEEVKDQWKNLQPPDDDSWLEITPGQLDEMMQKHAGYIPMEQGDSSELDLESMVFGMKSFVDKVSTHKGAEFPWSVDDSTAVQFEPDKFLETVEAMLEGRGGGEEEGSDTSDSGDLDSSSDEGEMAALMQQMDEELVGTEIGKSFEKVKLSEPEAADEALQEEHVELKPVDVDFNLVKNLLDSYSSQQGLAGPASNILKSMGVNIPDDTEQQTENR